MTVGIAGRGRTITLLAMKIGLAQINTTVGDFPGNREIILRAYRELTARGAELVLLPELAVCGYPPRDLLFKRRFVSDADDSLRAIAAAVGKVPLVVGTVQKNERLGRPWRNVAAWCEEGAVRQVGSKCLLPTYDVFDEDRYFEPGHEPTLVEHRGRKIGLTICEDIWTAPETRLRERYGRDPVEVLARQRPDLVLNLSASPWHRGKDAMRQEIVRHAARRCQCPVVYCNAVGGNDELIFDGQSLAVTADGQLMLGMAAFQENLALCNWTHTELHPTFHLPEPAKLHDALVLGLRDYAAKSGFRQALLGLSGGIDSSLVACLAARAFGPANVIGVSLPSAISSQHSQEDAETLARNLGIRFEKIGIQGVVEAAEAALRPIFDGLPRDVTEENIQARARGLLLMALSNKFGSLLLTTGNKSEMAVGYCTLYGDMCGGLAVISDVPKMEVYALSRWINREAEIIPQNCLDKPPSAELRPQQTDQDTLPPYPILDEILRCYVEEGQSRAEIAARGFDPAVVEDVCRKVDRNEYKRKQAAPGLKITPLAFGVGRRIPIVQKYIN